MPFYNDLRPTEDFDERDYALVFPGMSDEAKIRTIDGLLRLKTGLDAEVRPRRTGDNLLVASWNIKELGHTRQRLPEAYFYIAEVISRFDVVAVQEIKRTLKDLDIIMRILGSRWDYLVNDITEGNAGNQERSGYIFNTDRVELGGLAGELVAWDQLVQDLGTEITQLKRTPYVTGFKAGWKRFAMVSVHLEPSSGDEHAAVRSDEMALLLGALDHKLDSGTIWNRNIVLTGDFNLYDDPGSNTSWRVTDGETVAAINLAGYTEIDSLVNLDTNVSNTEGYDRFFVRKSIYFAAAVDEHDTERGGAFNPFDFVIRHEDHTDYTAEMKAVYGGNADLDDPDELESYFANTWRKNQISDHLPIWFELAIDSSVPFLESRRDALDDG